MLSDLKFALRQLAKSPGFTAVVLLTLALGIGVNTALFSVTDRLLYRPLPVPEPERLAIVVAAGSNNRTYGEFNYPLFRDYQRGNAVFEHLSATAPLRVGVGGRETTERRNALLVSGNYFSMLGITAALGRTFAPDEGVELDDAAVVVLSHQLWQAQFGADPRVIGQTTTVNGRTCTIIGVAPSEFAGTYRGQTPDLYVPFTLYGQLTDQRPGGEHPLATRYFTWHQIMGRLKPGVTRQQAQVAMQTLTQQIRAATPPNTPETIALLPGAQGMVDHVNDARRPLTLLRAIAALVLLIACANVANLQLTRASGRAREFAVRIALGASRARLWRGLLAESLVLSLLGGLLGLVAAAWLMPLLQQFQLPNQTFELGGELNGRLLAFACAVSLATGIGFGLAPAWQAGRTQPMAELKIGAGVTEPRGWRMTFRSALVVLQVALSLMVLVCAGLFTRSLSRLQHIDPGFDPSQVVVLSLDLELNKVGAAQAAVFYDTLLERTRLLPGVEAASLSWTTPLSGSTPGMGVQRIEGYEPRQARENLSADVNFVSSDYFRTLRVPVAQGREFGAADTATSPRVAIVNEAFVQRYRPGQVGVGWQIYVYGPGGPRAAPVPVEVVGIVRNVRTRNLTEEPRRMMFFPAAQEPRRDLTLAVRTGLEPAATIARLRELVKSLDANVPVFQIRTLEQQRAGTLGLQRLTATLLGGFGAVTLLLVTLGIYGVLAYSVARRTREIGLRLALGAQISDVFRLVFRQGFGLVGLGLGLGLGGAVAGARFLRSLLQGVEPLDPLTFATASGLFLFVAFVACFLPARGATKVDPLIALRTE